MASPPGCSPGLALLHWTALPHDPQAPTADFAAKSSFAPRKNALSRSETRLSVVPRSASPLGDFMTDIRARLLELFKSRAVAFGDFTLASGQKSSYYINSKKVLFHSEAAWLLGEMLWQATSDLAITAVGGLEVGAIPMATAAVLR